MLLLMLHVLNFVAGSIMSSFIIIYSDNNDQKQLIYYLLLPIQPYLKLMLNAFYTLATVR